MLAFKTNISDTIQGLIAKRARVAFHIKGLVNKKQILIIENRFIVIQNIFL